jgi:dihydrofolate reductase
MGRKTYEVAVSMGGATREKPKNNMGGKRSKPTVRTFIFSRTLRVPDDPNVELVAGEAAEFVRNLKRQPGKGICLMGGGELAQSLLAAGLVDEIGLNIHPVLLGSGIPTFRDLEKRVKLTLTECRRIDGGCILARYKVVRANQD